MDYLKDFEYLKPKAAKISYLQTFESTATTRKFSSPKQMSSTKDKSLGTILKPYIREYCDTSTVHGFRYLTHPDFKLYEKVIWLLILIATSISCSFVYVELADLYYSQRIQTTVADSVYPVYMTTFPSIGVCHPYRINWQRLSNEAPKKFLPPNVNNETLHTFYEFFNVMAQLEFSYLVESAPLFDKKPRLNLTLIDHLDLQQVMEYITFSCTEAFSGLCRWRKKAYNCCDIFTLERTEAGYCYVFNSAVSEESQKKVASDPYYPYHNSYSGEGSGLVARMSIDENKLSPNFSDILGVYVMIKQPEQWSADVKFVNYNTYTKLAITTQITETSQKARAVPPEVRYCFFNDESNHYMYKKIPGLEYWRGNCRTRCHQESLLKHCKCSIDFLFPTIKSDNFTICKPSDFKCVYEHAYVFSNEQHEFEDKFIDDVGNDSMTCNCLNNCNQVLYDGFFNSAQLEGVNLSDTVKYVHLDIHYQSGHILKYRTSMRYTFVELVANFGGIIGLFLGASLLSGVELVYYFTIGLYARLHKQIEESFEKNKQPPRRTRVKYKHVKAFKGNEGVHYKY